MIQVHGLAVATQVSEENVPFDLGDWLARAHFNHIARTDTHAKCFLP